MSQRPHQRAQKVVESFKSTLDESARNAVSEGKFDSLKLMIAEAISEELESAAARVDSLAKELRGLSEKQELGL